MSAELKAAVLAAAAEEPSPTRAAMRRRNILMGVLAATSGVAAFVVFALFASDGQLVRFGGAVAPPDHVERSLWPRWRSSAGKWRAVWRSVSRWRNGSNGLG